MQLRSLRITFRWLLAIVLLDERRRTASLSATVVPNITFKWLFTGVLSDVGLYLEMFVTFGFTLVAGRSGFLKEPTEITHHTRIKTPMISLLHSTDFLIKSFTVLVAYCAYVSWKEQQVQEIHLQRHSATHFPLGLQHIFN